MAPPEIEEARGPHIGLWGPFDIASFGDLLAPRIFEREIGRRLPLATVQPFAPLGHLHPVALDGGLPVEPLGPWEPARCAELASRLDFVAVCGGELFAADDDAWAADYGWSPEEVARRQPGRFFVDGLGPQLAASCPIAWYGLAAPRDLEPAMAARVRTALATKVDVAVCDEGTRERLLASGAEREIQVVPDSTLLLPGLFPEPVLARRLGFLRTLDWYPAERAPLVLQGEADDRQHASALAAALRAVLAELGDPPLVVLELAPCRGDGAFVAALASALAIPVRRMPASVALEDLVAALAHARAFVGSSFHGAMAALALGVPFVATDLGTENRLAGFARLCGLEGAVIREVAALPAALRRACAEDAPRRVHSVRERLRPRVEAHFDRLAVLAEHAWTARGARGERPGAAVLARAWAAAEAGQRALRRDLESLRARLLEERLHFAEIVDALEATGHGDAQLASRAAELRGWVEILEARVAQAEHARAQAEAERSASEGRLAAYEHLLGTRWLRGAARLQRLAARLRP